MHLRSFTLSDVYSNLTACWTCSGSAPCCHTHVWVIVSASSITGTPLTYSLWKIRCAFFNRSMFREVRYGCFPVDNSKYRSFRNSAYRSANQHSLLLRWMIRLVLTVLNIDRSPWKKRGEGGIQSVFPRQVLLNVFSSVNVIYYIKHNIQHIYTFIY